MNRLHFLKIYEIKSFDLVYVTNLKRDEDRLTFKLSVQPIIDHNFNHLKTMQESMGNQLINYVNKLVV